MNKKKVTTFTDKFSQAGIVGAAAGKALRESPDQFKKFSDSVKKMMPLVSIPFSKKYIKHREDSIHGFNYLAFCGIKITEDVINEIEKIRESTIINFSEACHHYVDNLST